MILKFAIMKFVNTQIAHKIATAANSRSVAAVAAISSNILHESQEKIFDGHYDLIVVGSGAAGCISALSAKFNGCKDVIVLEKSTTFGGTTSKSGGVFWIPNNHLMEKEDSKNYVIKLMAMLSFPTKYTADEKKLGLSDTELDWLVKYYDVGRQMVNELEQKRCLPHLKVATLSDKPLIDYQYDPANANKATLTGRALSVGYPNIVKSMLQGLAYIIKVIEPGIAYLSHYVPSLKELVRLQPLMTQPFGIILVQYLKKSLKKESVEIKMNSPVNGLIINDSQKVIGVRVRCNHGHLFLKAQKGVIFASGGFAQNLQMVERHLPGPIYGTCASSCNTGDFHKLAKELGCPLVEMDKVWGASTLLEERLAKGWESVQSVWFPQADSMIIVNKTGKRIFDEKMHYDSRLKIHWSKDDTGDLPNKLLFLITDERGVHLWGSEIFCSLPRNPKSKYYIKASNLLDLSNNIQLRLQSLQSRIGEFKLEQNFAVELQRTIKMFNNYAEDGLDEDFGRGQHQGRTNQWSTRHYTNDKPNRTMFPLSTTGPYYAVILAPSVLDTKGGPLVNEKCQVIGRDGEPIKGLFGAGNAVGTMSGEGYWSGGATIGQAMVMGWIAGKEATLS